MHCKQLTQKSLARIKEGDHTSSPIPIGDSTWNARIDVKSKESIDRGQIFLCYGDLFEINNPRDLFQV
ncbi:hypothetical protein AAZX31_05G210700 [Glycine max]